MCVHCYRTAQRYPIDHSNIQNLVQFCSLLHFLLPATCLFHCVRSFRNTLYIHIYIYIYVYIYIYTHTHIYIYIKVKVKESRNRPGVAQSVPGGLGYQISWHSAREGGEVVSLMHRSPLPPGMFLVLIFTRGCVDPRATLRSEGDYVTQPGIDPGTVRLAEQRLNHYAILGPIYIYIYTHVYMCPSIMVMNAKELRSSYSYLSLRVCRLHNNSTSNSRH
jgi:hypothetical protein